MVFGVDFLGGLLAVFAEKAGVHSAFVPESETSQGDLDAGSSEGLVVLDEEALLDEDEEPRIGWGWEYLWRVVSVSFFCAILAMVQSFLRPMDS